MLLVIGDAVEETVVDLRDAPPRGGAGSAHIVHRRGGSAANVAALAAELGQASRLAGQVGDDPAGDLLVDELTRRGVDVRVSRHGRTAAAVIVRSRGTTTRLLDRAGATQCTSLPADLLDGVTHIHLPASSLSAEPLATAVEDLVGEAVERGIPLSLDAAGAGTLEEIGAEQLQALVAQLRPVVFFCNRSESATLGLHGRDPMPGAAWTVITAGARPTLLAGAGGPAKAYPVTPVEGIVERDGAGDGFVAGFLLAHLAGQRPGTCVQAGHLVAARVLRRQGARVEVATDQARRGEVTSSSSWSMKANPA
jgi:sugar/nucleoside kinase (ribokinase family)